MFYIIRKINLYWIRVSQELWARNQQGQTSSWENKSQMISEKFVKEEQLFWNSKGVTRIPAKSKMKFFVTLVND